MLLLFNNNNYDQSNSSLEKDNIRTTNTAFPKWKARAAEDAKESQYGTT